MRTQILTVFILLGLAAMPVLAKEHKASRKEVARLHEAEEVVRAAVNAPDSGIPLELIERAECVGIFPGVKKGAFIVGGEYGHGIFTCRQADGEMGAPAYFSIGGGSIGWQWGGRSADLVLLIMNTSGIDHLLKDRFAMGGEASAVAGPVGRTVNAATDSQLHAQILVWSRSKGAFLGASLQGTVIRPDQEANNRYYGHYLSAKEILLDQKVSPPDSATSFLAAVNRYAKRLPESEERTERREEEKREDR